MTRRQLVVCQILFHWPWFRRPRAPHSDEQHWFFDFVCFPKNWPGIAWLRHSRLFGFYLDLMDLHGFRWGLCTQENSAKLDHSHIPYKVRDELDETLLGINHWIVKTRARSLKIDQVGADVYATDRLHLRTSVKSRDAIGTLTGMLRSSKLHCLEWM